MGTGSRAPASALDAVAKSQPRRNAKQLRGLERSPGIYSTRLQTHQLTKAGGAQPSQGMARSGCLLRHQHGLSLLRVLLLQGHSGPHRALGDQARTPLPLDRDLLSKVHIGSGSVERASQPFPPRGLCRLTIPRVRSCLMALPLLPLLPMGNCRDSFSLSLTGDACQSYSLSILLLARDAQSWCLALV